MMRTWTYVWKSSDGLRHEGEMSAASKDDVYKSLRERGIRAVKVSERIQPIILGGFSGLRKKDWLLMGLILVLSILALAIVFVYVSVHGRNEVVADVEQVEKIAPDPASRKALIDFINKKKASEQACREALIKRVSEGTLSIDMANGIFRAMGLEEIKKR